jgi:dTDP-4-amino-4,6-dideoxy-D-galactose acyltransferase
MTENPATEPLCSHLDWDSKFFNRRIARLNATHLDDEIVRETMQWCRRECVECLYFLANPGNAQTIRLAEANGFQCVDVRVTYERAVPEGQKAERPAAVRLARETDMNTLKTIARGTHHDSRFYFDQHFDRAQCDLFYETWIENSFRGYAQEVLVAEHDDLPVAYLSCHYKDRESQIGLVGVSADHQGKGLGSLLVQSFLAWSLAQGAARAKVVTQGRNVNAQRLYQKNGFVLVSQQVWYHRWFL